MGERLLYGEPRMRKQPGRGQVFDDRIEQSRRHLGATISWGGEGGAVHQV